MTLSSSLQKLSEGRSVLHWTGRLLLGALFWLALIRFPASPAAALDPSWQMTLGYAAVHPLQFGSDLVFTYGPLGYLLGATNIGELHAHHVLWQIFSNALLAGVLVFILQRLAAWRAVTCAVGVLLLCAPFPDVVHMLMILVGGIVLLREPTAASRGTSALIAAGLAILSLIKFTNLLLVACVLGCVAVFHFSRRRCIDGFLAPAAAIAVFFLGWILLGQSPAHIAAFLVNSARISSGYSEAMPLYESAAVFWSGLTAGFILLGCYTISVARSTDRPRLLATAIISIAASFMNWKHGFTRADSHVLVHFVFCLTIVFLYPAIFGSAQGMAARVLNGLLALCAAVSLLGLYVATPATLADAFPQLAGRIKENVYSLTSLHRLAAASKAQYDGIAAAHSMPEFKKLAGNQTVDVLGHEQAYAIFNQLNFRPRPVFQSYSAYSDDLLHLNADFYQSPQAPAFVLQKLQAIDERSASMDDSLVTRILYRDYSLIAEERGFLVWRRNQIQSAQESPRVLKHKLMSWDQTVEVPNHGQAPLWAQIDLQPTFLGRLRNFFYKAPIVIAHLNDDRGFASSHRLIPSMAKAGFLVDPYFSTTDQISAYEKGRSAPRIASLSVEAPEDQRKYFRSPVLITFTQLAAFPRSAPSTAPVTPNYPMFDLRPTSVTALFPPTVLNEAGHEVLFAHPPSEIVFEVESPAHHVTGGFGFTAAAYTSPNRTDGAEFSLEWQGADGRTTVIFNRLLRPVDVLADRGVQSFDLQLPPGKGRLTLRITPGPKNDLAFDWTYWSELKFTH